MVIYSQNIDLAITSLNDALEAIDIILLSSFFFIASEKCKDLVFTRRHYNNCPIITIKGYTIPFVNNYKYLGLMLDAKHRWSPHIEELQTFFSRWFNFFRSVANIWWNFYSTSLLYICKSVIHLCHKLSLLQTS